MSHRKAILLLALTAIFWSMGGILIKSVALHPLAIAGGRSAIAAIVLGLVIRRFKFIWTRAQTGAAICFTLTVIGFVSATKMTTAANAILLQYTAPIYVALLGGRLLGERITKRDIQALVVVMLGMVLFFVEEISPQHMLGNIIALASGVSFAGIALCLRMQNGVSTLESLFLGHLLTAAIGLPFFAMSAAPSSQDIVLLVTLGVLQLGIPYVLYGIAIRHVTALEASLIPVIEPILNPVWVALFASEIPSQTALLGGTIVIGAVIWHSLGALKKRANSTRSGST